MQLDDPTLGWYVPEPQFTHPDKLLEPEELAYVPEGQSVQLIEPDMPEYIPAEQLEQSELLGAPEKVPATQVEQDPAPEVEEVPAAQVTHARPCDRE